MKKRRIFYDGCYMENPVPYYTLKGWLRCKDKILNVNRYNSMNIDGFGIKLKPKRRHWRSFISCKLPKLVGNRVVYRLFKATVWYKYPNVGHRREEKYYQEEAYRE